MKTAFIYDQRLSQQGFGAQHPLQASRLHYVYELLQAYGAFGLGSLTPPRPAYREELLTFHTEDYLQAVEKLSRGEMGVDGRRYNFDKAGDNPPFLGMYEAASLPVGASIIAAQLIATEHVDRAFNPAGGLHHAAPDHASGFCIFNDPAIAIKFLLSLGWRVAYVDIDAHHGNGIQAAYYATDQVLTISLHESGQFLFPGTGEVTEMGTGQGKGYSVNLPLYPYTDDEVYLWAFREVVPPLVRAFAPHILVTQLGCDTHYRDPLTHLMLTTQGYSRVIQELQPLCRRWLALGGGGYDTEVVARAWTLAYTTMLEQELPNEIPESFQDKYGLKYLHDTEPAPVRPDFQKRAWQFARHQVEEIKRLIFPLHSL